MYDTSDIRKGLKIMIDGAPYTVVEFQFVKPGKGAAFTRTKMKNLLTGGVLERNLRSGERLEPADVETKTMQYLYKDADSFVFMDTTTYDQVQIPKDTIGDSAASCRRTPTSRCCSSTGAPSASRCRTSSSRRWWSRSRLPRRHRDRRHQAGQISTGASVNVPLFINVGDVIKIDTRTGQYLERLSRA